MLHCAAPDLRDAARVRSRDDALAALTAAYGAVLREFAGKDESRSLLADAVSEATVAWRVTGSEG